MAKSRTGKPSRKKRKRQRIKSERASGRGLPSRSVQKPAKKKAAERTFTGSRRPRPRSEDGEQVRRVSAREPDVGAPPAPSLGDRIRRLPNVAKIAAVAAVVVLAIWLIAHVRDRGSAARPTAATAEAVTPVAPPPGAPVAAEAAARDAGPPDSIMMAPTADEPTQEKPEAAVEEKAPPPAKPAAAEAKPKSAEPAKSAPTPAPPEPKTKPPAPAKPKPPPAPKPKPAAADEDNPY